MRVQVVFDLEFCPPGSSQRETTATSSAQQLRDSAPEGLSRADNVLPAEAGSVAALVAALNLGQVVAVPTDTLYGRT